MAQVIDGACAMEPYTPALVALLRDQPWMLRDLLLFNFMPARYLHSSHRVHFSVAGLNQAIWSEPRAVRHLSHFILEKLGLSQKPCLDLGFPDWPLVLLNQDRMLRLAHHIGAVLLAPKIRGSLARERVLYWKNRLTEDAYRFALGSASLLPVSEPATLLDEHTPAETLGFAWIKASLEEAPPELRMRAELKLPVSIVAPTLAPQAARQFVKRIHCALEPAWYSSFAALPH